MNANEIVKALKHCASEADCFNCVRQKEKCNVDDLKFEAAALIEQQQAEIAELKARLEKSVELPCNVDDTVWIIACKNEKPYIIDCLISSYSRYEHRDLITFHGWHGKGTFRTGWEIKQEDIGKRAFLTKAEAEQALKERESNGWINNR